MADLEADLYKVIPMLPPKTNKGIRYDNREHL